MHVCVRVCVCICGRLVGSEHTDVSVCMRVCVCAAYSRRLPWRTNNPHTPMVLQHTMHARAGGDSASQQGHTTSHNKATHHRHTPRSHVTHASKVIAGGCATERPINLNSPVLSCHSCLSCHASRVTPLMSYSGSHRN